MELHQEFEKEPNLDYYYNEEEEEEVEDEEEENEEEGGENSNKKKKKIEATDNKDNKEEDKKDENIDNNEGKKINKNEENNLNDENKNIQKNEGKNSNVNNIKNEDNNIINDENKINENRNNEENKNNENKQINENKINEDNNINDKKEGLKDNNEQKIEKVDVSDNIVNTESSKPQIEEEIDTTIPKTNKMIQNITKDGDIIIQSFSPNTICHRLIPKGSDLDISKKGCFKCYKIKTKKNLMSFITGSKIIKVPYLIFLDENYYYMAKDKIVNQRKPNLRRIGNRYDLLKLSNFQTSRKTNDYEFAFEFVNEDIFDRNFKLLYFTPKEAEDFYAVLHAILNGFGIQIPENLDDYGGAEEEEEEGEEYEDNEEGENEEEEDNKNEQEENNEDTQKNNVNEIKDDKNENKIENQQERKEVSENDENKIKDMTNSTKEESKDNDDL